MGFKFNSRRIVPLGLGGLWALLWVSPLQASWFGLQTYPNISQAIAEHDPLGKAKKIRVEGYHRSGDGGGGIFTIAADAANTNLGTKFELALGKGRYAIVRGAKPPYTVKQFGAYGDGRNGHDDTGSISNAMRVAAPGELRFPAGEYKMSAIVVPSHLKLVGESAAIYQISIPDEPGNYATASGLPDAPRKYGKQSPGFAIVRATNVVIRNFTFYMAPVETFFGGPQSAITVHYAQDVTVERCAFAYTNHWIATAVTASRNVVVQDNDFYANTFSTAQGPQFDDRVIGETLYDSSVMLGVDNLRVARNHFAGTNSAVRARIFFSSVTSLACLDNRLENVQAPTSMIYAYVGDLGLHDSYGNWQSNAVWTIERNTCFGADTRWSKLGAFIKTKGVSGTPTPEKKDSLRVSTAHGSSIAENVCEAGVGLAGLDLGIAGGVYERNRIVADCQHVYLNFGDSSDSIVRGNRFEGKRTDLKLRAPMFGLHTKATNSNLVLEGNVFVGDCPALPAGRALAKSNRCAPSAGAGTNVPPPSATAK